MRRNKPKFNYSIVLTIILLTVIVINSNLNAEEHESESLFSNQNQGGIRLGVWSNRGGTPPELSPDSSIESKINDENIYFEAFYGYRFTPVFLIEGALGLVNRGSVSFVENGEENVGNLSIYTMLIKAKLYPLGSSNVRIQPYLLGGGGYYYGRRSVQFTTNYNIEYVKYGEQTADDFSYCFGGGIDYPLSSVIGLDFEVKYLSIGFSKSLLGIQNYDALAFSIGVKYLYQSK